MDASSAPNNLPALRDRLPELCHEIELSIQGLKKSNRSALLAVEPLYEKVHSLKGLTKILQTEETLSKFLFSFNEDLSQICKGASSVCMRDECATQLEKINQLLHSSPIVSVEINNALLVFRKTLKKIDAAATELPFTMPTPDARAYSRWHEAKQLGYKCFSVEESILLQEIPKWRSGLLECMKRNSEDRAFLVHSIPFVFAEASRSVRFWVCFAVPKEMEYSLLNQIKSQLPGAHFKSLAN